MAWLSPKTVVSKQTMHVKVMYSSHHFLEQDDFIAAQNEIERLKVSFDIKVTVAKTMPQCNL